MRVESKKQNKLTKQKTNEKYRDQTGDLPEGRGRKEIGEGD